MTWFLDTNHLVESLRGNAPHVRDRLREMAPSDILIPFQVVAELRLGAAKSRKPRFNRAKVDDIIHPFAIAWPTEATLAHYVEIRAVLEKRGTRIGDPDLWIAALARAAGAILVTHNTREFSRVPDLKIEDWLVF